jgi:hypothetical protein
LDIDNSERESKMKKHISILGGIALIFMGLLALAATFVMPMLGIDLWLWSPWRLWPLIVVSAGWFFVVPPLLVRGRRGLGGLFIPGVPILTTGMILLVASVLNWWRVWTWLWPLEVLAVAVGFALSALYMRVIWLMIPAIIIGANGLVFQFCAITGRWETWALLWTIEPLSVGLSLLVVGAKKRLHRLMLAGLIICGVAGVGLVGMTAILFWWLIKILGPMILVLSGLALLIWGLVRPRHLPRQLR